MRTVFFLCLWLIPTIVLAQNRDMYVVADSLNVRLQPSHAGKVTNTLYRGQKVTVFEVSSGWARISQFYYGGLEGVTGNVARWVSEKYLSANKPTKGNRKKSSTRLESALSSSDDYAKYKVIFLEKSLTLIEMGRCKVSDFEEVGGWLRSVNYKPRRVYFTYCGNHSHTSGRIYLDMKRKKIFQ